MTDDEIGVGELGRSLRKLDETVRDQFQTLNTRLDAQRFVTKELYDSENKAQNARIRGLEDRFRNAARVAAGAVLAIGVPIIIGAIRVFAGGS